METARCIIDLLGNHGFCDQMDFSESNPGGSLGRLVEAEKKLAKGDDGASASRELAPDTCVSPSTLGIDRLRVPECNVFPQSAGIVGESVPPPLVRNASDLAFVSNGWWKGTENCRC